MRSYLSPLQVEVQLYPWSSKYIPDIESNLESMIDEKYFEISARDRAKHISYITSEITDIKSITFQDTQTTSTSQDPATNILLGTSSTNGHNVCFHIYKDRQSPLANPDQDDDWEDPYEIDSLDISHLPNEKFEHEWAELHFNSRVKHQLLAYCHGCIKIGHMENHVSNLILLHGEPGTGKTSLARAVAQKLAIQTYHDYSQATFLEVNVSAMLDKHVGNSQKNILRTFDRINQQAGVQDSLCVVAFDEIESIAGSRTAEMSTGNRDVGRATNALLVCLDKVRSRSNVLIFCTSNIVDQLDKAFLSRVGLMEHIPFPGLTARYQILQASFADILAKGQILRGEPQASARSLEEYRISPDSDMIWRAYKLALEKRSPDALITSEAASLNDTIGGTIDENHSTNDTITSHNSTPHPVESYGNALLHLLFEPYSLTTGVMLLAMQTEGLSGRVLRRASIAALMGSSSITTDRALVLIEKALLKALRDGR